MGSGMSAIAQYLAWSGHEITGSDRIAFADEMKDCKEKLERCGCTIIHHFDWLQLMGVAIIVLY
jgi:UDP-N-acetylmuramate-alanine ligase